MTLDVATRALADRLAITEVLHRYARGVDTVDPDTTASCFMADCRFEIVGDQLVRGRDELLAMLRDESGVRQRTTGLEAVDSWTHVVSNVEIDLDGDRADVRSMITAYLAGPRNGRAVMLVRLIRYADLLVRRDEAWLIAERRHSLNWMFEVAPTYLAPPGPAVIRRS
jgi:hypothetical protein